MLETLKVFRVSDEYKIQRKRSLLSIKVYDGDL
jgi:hypothetical protein